MQAKSLLCETPDANRRRVLLAGDAAVSVGVLVAAVLIDRTSASASEIFAAAIQDWGRGIIIGEPSFGKGTVQNLYPLDRWALGANAGYGELTVTIRGEGQGGPNQEYALALALVLDGAPGIAEPFPELGHVHVDHIRSRIEVQVPDLLEEHRPTHRLAGPRRLRRGIRQFQRAQPIAP